MHPAECTRECGRTIGWRETTARHFGPDYLSIFSVAPARSHLWRPKIRIAISPWTQIAFANAHNSADYPRASPDRSFPGLAIQFGLGLLSERRDRPDFIDRADPCSGWPHLNHNWETTAGPSPIISAPQFNAATRLPFSTRRPTHWFRHYRANNFGPCPNR